MPEPETVGETQLAGETLLIGTPELVTGDAEIRPGEKFAEDALCQTCKLLRQELASRKESYTRNMDAAERMLDAANIEVAALKKKAAQAREILI